MRSGILAEFDSPEALERAFERLRRDGYTRLSAFTPYPVRGVLRHMPESMIPWIMLGAALFGGGFGYLLQWWCNARAYAINVGGRPLHSPPALIPITFESAVLASCVTGFFVLLYFCGLPRLHDPLLAVEGFERASIDRFWLGVDEADPRFDERLQDELPKMGALRSERLRGAP